MSQVPLPKKGCFEAGYPDTEWREVPCTTPPGYPQVPGTLPQPPNVGGGGTGDFAARVSSRLISSAQGSFDSVTGVTEESGQVNNTGPSVSNTYTLQINTNLVPTNLCNGSPNPNCRGWEQFVFDSHASIVHIQYLLIKYNTSCSNLPGSWKQFSFPNSSDIYCWRDDLNGAKSVPFQPVANLSQLTVTATAGGGGDFLVLSTANNVYMLAGDNVFNVASSWTDAEFNVFGDAGGGQANFNIGTTIVDRTGVNNGTTNAPLCPAESFTGETSNLYLVLPCTASGGPSPAIVNTMVAPPAASPPFVNVYSGHDQQHFAYLATNANSRLGEIWDVYYCPGCSDNKWQLQKITLAARPVDRQ